MGDHCAHVESTIGRAHNIFYRDIPYAPHETRREKVGISALIRHAEICRDTDHWDLHQDKIYHSGILGGHEENIKSVPKGRGSNRRGITKKKMVGPGDTTRVVGIVIPNWGDRENKWGYDEGRQKCRELRQGGKAIIKCGLKISSMIA